MTRRRLIVLLGAVTLFVFLAVFLWPDSNEPRYNREKLSHWIITYRNTDPGPEHSAAEAAISAIGTNAIPFLLHWLQEEPSPARRKIRNALPRGLQDNQLVFSLLNARPSQAASAAPRGFRALGTNAALAVPGLLSISQTNNAMPGAMAVITLADMGQPGFAATLSIITNGTARHRFLAMRWMAQNRSLYSDPSPAIPILVSSLTDTNPLIVQTAAEILGEFKLQPGIVVPHLADALTNSRPSARLGVITALENYGSNAAPALNALSNCVNDSHPGVRSVAATAIEKIQAELSPQK